MKTTIVLFLLLACLLVSQAHAASWKTTDDEDSSVNGGEIVLLENEAGTGNNWMSLDTIKTWFAALFEPLKGADDNYVTLAEKTVIGNTSGTNTGDQDLSGKQDTLVSGTNIKTINSTSLVGAGDIVVTGDGTPGVLVGDLKEWDGDSWEPETPDEVTFESPLALTGGVVSLNDTTVTPGSYTNTNLTVDAKGRITVATNGTAGSTSITEATETIHSDSPGNPGDMKWDDTKLYLRNNTNWVYTSWTDDLPMEPVPFLVESVTVGTLGLTADILFPEEAYIGTGGSGGFSMLCEGRPIAMTYSSGAETTTLNYTLSETPYDGEICTVDYTQPSDGIETTTGTDLVTFSGGTVTNNSTEPAPSIGYVDPDFSYNFEDQSLTPFTVITGSGANTVAITDIEPISDTYSLSLTKLALDMVSAHITKDITSTGNYGMSFKVKLSSDYQAQNTGGEVAIATFLNNTATVVSLKLKWNGTNMVFSNADSVVLSRGVEHEITYQLISGTGGTDGAHIYLDGVRIYESALNLTLTSPNKARIGATYSHNYNSGIEIKFDDWEIGSYVE